jgi:hypothetical protein
MLFRRGDRRIGDDKILRQIDAVFELAAGDNAGARDLASRVLARQYARSVRSRAFKEAQLGGKYLAEKERVKAVRIRPEWEPGKPGAPIRFTIEVELYENCAAGAEALRGICEYIREDLFAPEVVDGFAGRGIEFVMTQAGLPSQPEPA